MATKNTVYSKYFYEIINCRMPVNSKACAIGERCDGFYTINHYWVAAMVSD
jgi:hypothetical protein